MIDAKHGLGADRLREIERLLNRDGQVNKPFTSDIEMDAATSRKHRVTSIET